ncbi:MAG: hypothetical protein K0S46_329 [Moraxellaceae bacterium]|jgi:hypothetical protein|nr:hypothetical protein [Moraxellaceae bacterium]
MSDDRLPLSRPTEELLRELRSEVLRLENEREHFDELPPGCRLSSRDAYEARISVRLELLRLLAGPARNRQ